MKSNDTRCSRFVRNVLFLGLILLAGCANVLEDPGRPSAKPGTVTLRVGSGPERTAMPAITQFAKITLTIEGQDDTDDLPDVDASDGGVEVEFLAQGSWKITAKAYLNAADLEPAAQSVPHDFSWNGTTVTGDTRFILVPKGNGNGTLKYTVTIPEAVSLTANSRIQIEKDGAAWANLDGSGFTDGVHLISANEADMPVNLEKGYYTADIVLEDNSGNTAVYRESVVILPGLVTEIAFAPGSADFLNPEIRAAMTVFTDLEFGNTNLFDGSITVGNPTTSGLGYTLAIGAEAGKETVYFTLTKTADYSVTIGGTDHALVKAFADGEGADGSYAGPDLAVFKVDTSSIKAEGGTKIFTLTVAQEGKTGVPVEVTLTVAAPETGPGPGLYIDSGTGGTETLTPVEGTTATGLQAMLTYLAASAANNTKYVVLVNDDSEMTSLFSSKSGSTGVRITLRGIGTERRIYTHISSSGSYCFTINSGTTLALGTNITLSGDINNVGWIRPYSGGALEMLAGSKIANTTTTHAALISLDGVGSSFTMNNGAAITNNNLYFSESSGTTQAIKMVRENVAAVSVNNGTFTMNGGEISGTNYRGVYIFTLNSLNPPSLFTMKNGVITNNGKSGITFTGNTNSATGFVKDQVYYPWGAGVYIGYSNSNTAKMVMEGGVISDNGNGTPGSGIYVDTDGDPTALSSLVLDGAVAVTNNTVACSTFTSDAADGSCIHLGENFSSDAPIAVDLCILDNSTVSLWKNRQLLYPKLSSGVTIGASHTALFSLAGYYYTPGDPNIGIVEYTNLNYTINSSGVVVQTE